MERLAQYEGVTKARLANGLTIILKEMHHAPLASFWVWYKVGSRHERPGMTGIAHWVEHMMFKGTPDFPAGTLDRAVSREGGRWNAFTWLDFTAYYETLPAEKLGLALRLEADRMVNTIMKPDEVESERTVILSERRMYENKPMFLLYEEIQAVAFRVHSYHHEVIGDACDLETMTRDDLYRFYRQYYSPNNATIVCVGSFDTEQLLEQIEEQFGEIRPSEQLQGSIRPEPRQRGEREVTLYGAGDTAYLAYSYKSPAANSADYLPMALLNAAFSGGGSLGMFAGGGTSNKSSRLYQSLVSSELAVAVQGGLTPTIDPFLYTIIAIPRPDKAIAEVEAALSAEIARLADQPLTQRELDKARKQARVSFIQASESITGQAQMIGMSESVVGDHRWFENALVQLEQITLEDIERVRQKYLHDNNRIIGRYLPESWQNTPKGEVE